MPNGGMGVNADLTNENYPTLLNNGIKWIWFKPYKTVDVIIRNNNQSPVKLDLIIKAGLLGNGLNLILSLLILVYEIWQFNISLNVGKIGDELKDAKMIGFNIHQIIEN